MCPEGPELSSLLPHLLQPFAPASVSCDLVRPHRGINTSWHFLRGHDPSMPLADRGRESPKFCMDEPPPSPTPALSGVRLRTRRLLRVRLEFPTPGWPRGGGVRICGATRIQDRAPHLTFLANRVLLAIPGLGHDQSFLERDGRAEEEGGTPQGQRCLIQSTRRCHPSVATRTLCFERGVIESVLGQLIRKWMKNGYASLEGMHHKEVCLTKRELA